MATLAASPGLAIVTWLLLPTNSLPVNRFWPQQFSEGGDMLVLFMVLVTATVWLARRRAG